jgi:predicted PurR-regulated permease PerM
MLKETKIPSNYYSIMKWAGIFIIIGGIKVTSHIILPLLLAIFISLMLLQPVHWLQAKKVPKNLAIILVLILFMALFYVLGDLLGSSLSHFSDNLPAYKMKLMEIVDANKDTFKKFGIDLNDGKTFNAKPGAIMNFLLLGLDQAKQFIAEFFLIMLLTLFFLFELDSFPVKFNAMFNRIGSKKASINLNKIILKLRRYLGIKSITSFATGLLIYLFLMIMGVKYAILWGMIAFLLNYIPNIGSLIAAIPAVIFAGIQLGGGALLYTGIVYLLVNFIIGSLLEPRIMGKGMGLSTAVILISLMFWGWLFGPIGMFLSVPLTMVLKVFLEANEDSRYFAILIGTEEEAKQYSKNGK